MPTHVAAQIMAAIKTKVTGLTTTGNNVQRDKQDAWPDTVQNAISIFQGPDAIADYETGQVLATLTVYLDNYIKRSADQTLTDDLAQIRLEETAALRDGTNLGLSFVYNVEEQDAAEPTLGVGGTYTAEQRCAWLIRYFRDQDNPV